MTPIGFLNSVMGGVFAFASVHHVFVWRTSRRAETALLIAAYAAFSALQTLGVILLAAGTTTSTAQAGLNVRTTFGLAATATLAWLLARLSGFQPRRYLKAVTALLATGIAINFIIPLGGTVSGVSIVDMPWGEAIHVADRESRAPVVAIAVLMYFCVLSVYVFAAVAGVRWARTDATSGRLTVIAGVAGVVVAVFALLIDLEWIQSPYIGQISNLVWILVATILVSREHASREQRLENSETKLAASEARYRTLIESAPEAIVVFDTESGTFADVNAEACRLFDAPASRLSGMNPVVLSAPIQPDGRPSTVAAAEYLEQAIRGGTPVFEWTHRTVGGKDIPCEVRLVRLPDTRRVLVRGSVTDISGRRQLEEQLRQSQKMEAIGQLAGGVAHDFNNLLTVISGYAEILQSKLQPADPNAALVKAIGDATERAAWLTARLLAFGRRAVLTPQVFDLNILVGDGERILRRLIGEHIALKVEAAIRPLHVTLDPGQWSQVMLNLAINARDAMPAGGALTIRTFEKAADPEFLTAHPGISAGRYAAFSVTDTGMGMSPEIRAHIFEPFFTTKEVGKGTGLGLAVVHGIVSQAGGCVDVSTAPGSGTTFTVYLPAAEDAPVSLRAPTDGRLHGAGESVLVVEDESVLRDLLDVALTAHGFRVSTARDGDDALRLLDSTGSKIDLLVTDMVMPGRLNGRALAEAVRHRAPNVKVLFISGYIDDPAIRDSGFSHGEPWLQKPFSLAAIAQKARETLDGN